MAARPLRGIVNGKSVLPFLGIFWALQNVFRIKVTHVSKNATYEFPVEKLLDENVEAGSSNLILFSATKEELNEGELATPRTLNTWRTVGVINQCAKENQLARVASSKVTIPVWFLCNAVRFRMMMQLKCQL